MGFLGFFRFRYRGKGRLGVINFRFGMIGFGYWEMFLGIVVLSWVVRKIGLERGCSKYLLFFCCVVCIFFF